MVEITRRDFALGTLASATFIRAPGAQAQPNGERHEIVQAGAATIRVTVRGHGDPIVLIPSYGRGAEDFDDLSKRLVRAGYEAILPQPRGIGGSTGPLAEMTLHSEAADIAAVIRSVAGGKAILLGHAHGHQVARMTATDYPELVTKEILLSVGGMVPRSPDIDIAFHRVFDSSLSEQEHLVAIQTAFFATGHNASVWQDGWYRDVAAAQMAGVARVHLQEYWAGGSAPILVLQGTEDVIAVPENSKRIKAEFPDRVTVVEIPNSGHAMLPEQPEKIAAAILAYLKR